MNDALPPEASVLPPLSIEDGVTDAVRAQILATDTRACLRRAA